LGKCKRWMRRRANSDCVSFPLPLAKLLAPPSATPVATATGAIAVQLNILLLDISAISSISFLLPGPFVQWPGMQAIRQRYGTRMLSP
jgi:hypothetical protein